MRLFTNDQEGVKALSQSKHLLHNQFKRWKNAASQLISTEEEDGYSHVVELEPAAYALCKRMAEAQETSVSAVVHYLIEQQSTGRSHESMFQASLEQRERNPLLQLDAMTRHSRSRKEEEDDVRP